MNPFCKPSNHSTGRRWALRLAFLVLAGPIIFVSARPEGGLYAATPAGKETNAGNEASAKKKGAPETAPESIFARAIYFRSRGQFREAVRLLREFEKSTGGNYYSERNLAEIFYSTRDYPWARRYGRKALERRPDSIPVLLLLARVELSQKRIQPALDYLKQIEKIDENNTEALAIEGQVYLKGGDLDKAKVRYRRIVNIGIRNDQFDQVYFRALEVLAGINLKQKKIRHAYVLYQTYNKRRPNQLKILMKLGYLAKILGNFDKATDYYRNILRLQPKNRVALESVAEVYYIQGDFRAINYFRRLVARLPQPKKEPLIYGLYLDLRGKSEEALPYVRAYMEKNSVRLSCQIFLRKYYRRQANWPAYIKTSRQVYVTAIRLKLNPLAERVLKEVLDLARGDSPAGFREAMAKAGVGLASVYNGLAEIQSERGEYALAVADYRQALSHFYRQVGADRADLLRRWKTTPPAKRDKQLRATMLEIVKIRLKIIMVYYDQGRLEPALRETRVLQEWFPNLSRLDYINAIIYMKRGDFGRAHGYMEKVLAAQPGEAYYYVVAAHVAEMREDETAVFRYLEKSLKLNGKDPRALNFLGYYMLEKNRDTNRALRLIRKAVALDPENAHYRDSLGWGYYKIGRDMRALEELKLAAEISSVKEENHAEIFYHLGMVYQRLGKSVAAVRYGNLALSQVESDIREIEEQKNGKNSGDDGSQARKKQQLKQKILRLIRKLDSAI